jgi:hypothetical protein
MAGKPQIKPAASVPADTVVVPNCILCGKRMILDFQSGKTIEIETQAPNLSDPGLKNADGSEMNEFVVKGSIKLTTKRVADPNGYSVYICGWNPNPNLSTECNVNCKVWTDGTLERFYDDNGKTISSGFKASSSAEDTNSQST